MPKSATASGSASSESTAKAVKSKMVHVAGLNVQVFGLDALTGTSDCVVAIWMHGRLGKHQDLHSAIQHVYARLAAKSKERPLLPLVFVTFDHRNHGARLVDRTRNFAWKDFKTADEDEALLTNPTHALDMYSIQTGTAQDVSLLVDFLPAALFPRDEHHISRWVCMGTSLGGHSTWIAGSLNPKLTYLIPFIGSPSTTSLLQNRAVQSNLQFAPPLIPDSFKQLLARSDPFELSLDRWQGKHILAVCGGSDPLVPPKEGRTQQFIDKLQKRGVDAELFIEEGVGHKVTENMLNKSADWLAEHPLSKVEIKSVL